MLVKNIRPLVPELGTYDFEILWHVDYYNGPLSGVLSWKGERFWFEVVDDGTDNVKQNLYGVFRLTPEQLAEEDYWHSLFVEHVGAHWEYGEARGPMKPTSEHHKFYDKAKERGHRSYSGNEVVAWFEP